MTGASRRKRPLFSLEHKAWVRTVSVEGVSYVQAVRIIPRARGGKAKLKVLESFGRLVHAESWLRARLYVQAYNSLLEMSSEDLHQANPLERTARVDLEYAFLSAYGFILGRKTVEELSKPILDKLKGAEK